MTLAVFHTRHTGTTALPSPASTSSTTGCRPRPVAFQTMRVHAHERGVDRQAALAEQRRRDRDADLHRIAEDASDRAHRRRRRAARRRPRPAPVISLVKLLVLAALVLAVAHWGFALAGLPMAVVVMMAALPVGSNALIFAQRHETLEAEAPAAIFFSTLAFAATATLWLGVLTWLGRQGGG